MSRLRRKRAGPFWKSKRPPEFEWASRELLAQAKLLDQLVIFPGVPALEIVEQLATLVDHFQQAAPGMVILDVRLEVVGQPVDAGRKQGDLHFRGTRIAGGALVLLDDLRFLRNACRHALSSLRQRRAFYLEISAFHKRFGAAFSAARAAASAAASRSHRLPRCRGTFRPR